MAFDIIGSKEKAVAIIENRKLAKEILKKHKNVKSVLLKISKRIGKKRIYKYKLIAGSKNTEVIHREYGMEFKLNPRKVYFSPRESTERQKIANKVKNREKILVMFSGIGVIPITIAKKRPDSEITCVDINPNAIKYANENVKSNGLYNIENICSDARKIKSGKFNRIIMPLPENAIDYLDVAFKHSKKGTIIHLYGLSNAKLKDRIKKIAKNIKYKIIKKEKVLPYAPHIMKIRIDLRFL